ncbi:MAG: VOC family protein [Magnetococcales bacterium]|nr:VOC family protein [Magnetococcales bacterium]
MIASKPTTGLDAIGIVSRNIERSVSFYGILGMKFIAVGGEEHWEGMTPSGVRFMLDAVELVKRLDPGWVAPTGVGIILCFKQESATEVDALFARVTEAGFDGLREPWDAFWGQRYASVRDPDGNQIDLFASL